MPLKLIGQKIGMTQIFDEEGKVTPVTILQLGPCYVLQIKTKEKDGYSALQLGWDDKYKNVNKPDKGLFDKTKVFPKKVIKEIRFENDDEIASYNIGDKIDLSVFQAGDIIDVHGVVKGKGFQGVVKRYGFHGGKASHGSRFHRRPGSIGMHQDPGRVWKGQKLPGHMGNVNRTILNLKVMDIHSDENLLVVKGAIPGPARGVVMVRKSVKAK